MPTALDLLAVLTDRSDTLSFAAASDCEEDRKFAELLTGLFAGISAIFAATIARCNLAAQNCAAKLPCR